MQDSSTQIIIFNKKGDKMGTIFLPQMLYLETEKEWIQKRIDLSPSELDGMALAIDWNERKVTSVRFSNE